MGLWDKLKGEIIDIVEWLDDTQNTMVYRFERFNNEIKNGAQLVVREGQAAVFIDQGQCADVFLPGMYTLDTKNLPLLSTLKGWKYGFNSPFKAEVYFCSTRQFAQMKWGTPGPATMRDPDFGMVRASAHGIYSLRIKDPKVFMKEIVGTAGTFTTEDIENNLRGKIGVFIKEVMPELGIPVAEIEAKSRIMGEMLVQRLQPEFQKLGVEVVEIQVQDIALPEEVEKAIDKAGAMRALGGNMQAYAMYEAAGSMKDMAQNPGAGGLAGAGLGMGMGMAVGGQMAQGMAPQAGPGTPPPVPQPIQFFVAVGGQQAGPFDVSGLQQQIQSGQITRDTLVWRQGMAAWTKAGMVAELASLFAAMPPPVPPPA